MKTDVKKAIFRFVAPPSLSASFVPIAVGTVCAFTWGRAQLHWSCILWVLLELFAITCVEAGKHALNELMDFHSGADVFVDEAHLCPVAGGKKVLKEGLATEKQVMVIAVVLLSVAAVCGLVICHCRSWAVIWYGLAGFALAITYNAEPFKLIYRGLGETELFLAYGPVCTLGAYSVFAGDKLLLPLLLSCAIGFFITNVLIINEFPDYEADKKAKKRNLLVRRGPQKAMGIMLLLYWSSFVPLAAASLLAGNPLYMLPLVTIPRMLRARANLAANLDDVPGMLPSNLAVISIHKELGACLSAALVFGYFFLS